MRLRFLFVSLDAFWKTPQMHFHSETDYLTLEWNCRCRECRVKSRCETTVNVLCLQAAPLAITDDNENANASNDVEVRLSPVKALIQTARRENGAMTNSVHPDLNPTYSLPIERAQVAYFNVICTFAITFRLQPIATQPISGTMPRQPPALPLKAPKRHR